MNLPASSDLNGWAGILAFFAIEIGFLWRLAAGLVRGRFSSIDDFKGILWIKREASPARYWICGLMTLAALAAWTWYGWEYLGIRSLISN